MKLCTTCCTTLDGSTAVPSHSEKADPPPVSFACGLHQVCGACVRKNRRLAQSCVLCETANDVLGGTSTSAPATSTATPRATSPPRYDVEKADGDFVLGGDSDDEDPAARTAGSPPPPPLGDEGALGEAGEGLEAPPAYEAGGVELGDADGKGRREQCALHHVRPHDTLVGLAFEYGVEGHVLCQLNKLPLSTLSTTPHLLHTKPFLILPPTARRPSSSAEPILPAPLERKRLVVRRFQVATKCADWATARAYVDAVFHAREQEARFVAENRRARGGEAVDGDDELEVREGGELEEAVRAYEADERWEREQRNVKGKGVLVHGEGGTARADARAAGRGWGWRG
ncbi:hypothetical protein JCM3775_000643 [Rhodotorula graminis]